MAEAHAFRRRGSSDQLPLSATLGGKDQSRDLMAGDAGLSDAELYERYASELVRYATGLVGPADAQDVVSAAVLSCMTRREWERVQNRKAYLYRAVLNEARGMRRSTSRRLVRESKVARRDVEGAADLRPEVLAAAARLSLRQRSVVVLTYWADLEGKQVGELLGISEGSVRRHLARARQRLRSCLDEEQ